MLKHPIRCVFSLLNHKSEQMDSVCANFRMARKAKFGTSIVYQVMMDIDIETGSAGNAWREDHEKVRAC